MITFRKVPMSPCSQGGYDRDRSSPHQKTEAQARQGRHDDDDAHENRSFGPAHDSADNDHVGEGQGRTG